jgi:hypothetical protein
MKFRPVYIAIIFVLVVIVFMGSSCGSTYIPYSKTTYFDHAFPYEGMATIDAPTMNNTAVVPISGNVLSSNGNVAPTAGNTMNSYMNWMTSWIPYGQNISNTATRVKVEGFSLQPAPFNAPELIDRYGKTPGKSDCFGKSMGYSRSTGPLCFNDEDLKLLTTRGGNVSGSDSTIGQHS